MSLALVVTAAGALAQPKGAAPAPSASVGTSVGTSTSAKATAIAAPAAAKGAAPGGKGPAGKPVPLDLAALGAKLNDPATAASAFATAIAAGPAAKALAPRIEEMLRKGMSPDLTVSAIQALEAMGSFGAAPVIAPYVQHRSPDVRRAAAMALSNARDPEGAAALRKGLRSNDATLRGLCAAGLGAAGDKESVPDLAKALDRGISEAAPSIAGLCVGPPCDDLVTHLEKLPAPFAKAALEAMLRRKPALADDLLLAAIEKTKPAAAASAKAYFSALAKGFKGSKKVQKALDAAAHPPKEAKP